jgi:2-dehydro-3-deoxygalactonokinase
LEMSAHVNKTSSALASSTGDDVAHLIALDWGTSSLRAYLMASGGRVVEHRSKPWGIMHTPDGDFAKALLGIAGDWIERMPNAAIVAAGMIGSKQGWHEVAYRSCPVGLTELAAGIEAFAATDRVRLHVVPGVAKLGELPDVMRGEETQIIGALEQAPNLSAGAHLVMPGTHSKWVRIRKGVIESFITYMTGELFAVLRDHSILGRPMRETAEPVAGSSSQNAYRAFARGISTVRASGAAGLLPLLFSARTLHLTGQLGAADSVDYLSGLLIGEELRCGLAQRSAVDNSPLALIGDPTLCDRYQRAFDLFGISEVPMLIATSPTGLWRIAMAGGLLQSRDSVIGTELGS